MKLDRAAYVGFGPKVGAPVAKVGSKRWLETVAAGWEFGENLQATAVIARTSCPFSS